MESGQTAAQDSNSIAQQAFQQSNNENLQLSVADIANRISQVLSSYGMNPTSLSVGEASYIATAATRALQNSAPGMVDTMTINNVAAAVEKEVEQDEQQAVQQRDREEERKQKEEKAEEQRVLSQATAIEMEQQERAQRDNPLLAVAASAVAVDLIGTSLDQSIATYEARRQELKTYVEQRMNRASPEIRAEYLAYSERGLDLLANHLRDQGYDLGTGKSWQQDLHVDNGRITYKETALDTGEVKTLYQQYQQNEKGHVIDSAVTAADVYDERIIRAKMEAAQARLQLIEQERQEITRMEQEVKRAKEVSPEESKGIKEQQAQIDARKEANQERVQEAGKSGVNAAAELHQEIRGHAGVAGLRKVTDAEKSDRSAPQLGNLAPPSASAKDQSGQGQGRS